MGSLKDILFPPRCAFCKGLLCEDEEFLCKECAKDAVELKTPAASKGSFYNKALAAFPYTGGPRRGILGYKFRSRPHLAEFFGVKMAEKVKGAEWQFDIITAVPSHRHKTRKKGFDHAYLLAQEVAKHTDKPCTHMLRRTRRTKPMYGLTPSQRRANVMGSIEVIHHDLAQGKRILLCDDILTTGSTVSECARMLKGAGAKEVWVIAATAKK